QTTFRWWSISRSERRGSVAGAERLARLVPAVAPVEPERRQHHHNDADGDHGETRPRAVRQAVDGDPAEQRQHDSDIEEPGQRRDGAAPPAGTGVAVMGDKVFRGRQISHRTTSVARPATASPKTSK